MPHSLKNVLDGKEFWSSLINTFKYAIVEAPFSVVLALVLTAFKTVSGSTSVNPFVIFSSSWKFDSFTTVWKSYNFLCLYRNTLLVIFFRVVCAVPTATMAGYVFGRLKLPLKNFLFSLVLVPSQIFLEKPGENNPFAVLCAHGVTEDAGERIGLMFAYSGNIRIDVELDQLNSVRAVVGISDA